MVTFFFKDDGFIPNSPFPVVVNRRAVSSRDMDSAGVEAALRERALKTGWNLEWLWRVYKQPHYHSTTHEALIVYSGTATLRIGGHRLGSLVQIKKGDSVVIPAGVAHQAMEKSQDFQVFGLYPVGANQRDLLFCRKKERDISLPNLAKMREPPDFVL